MAERQTEYGQTPVTGMGSSRPGNALIKASSSFKTPKVPRASKLPNPKAPKLAKAPKGTARLY